MAIKVFPTDFVSISGTLTRTGFIYTDDGTSNGYVTPAQLFGLLAAADITTALTFTPVNAATVGAANGVAQLDAGSHVPVAQISLALGQLSNTNVPTPTNGQVLTYDTASGKWIATSPTAVVTTLAGLSDVGIASPTNGQYLTYDTTSSKWKNTNLPTIITTLAGLSDVNMGGGPTNGQVLTYDTITAKWLPATPGGLPSIADGSIYANISGTSAAGGGTTLTAYLDHVLGTSRGTIIFRGAAGWTSLGPGAAGSVLVTNGSTADPTWTVAPTGTISAHSVLMNSGTAGAAPAGTPIGSSLTDAGGTLDVASFVRKMPIFLSHPGTMDNSEILMLVTATGSSHIRVPTNLGATQLGFFNGGTATGWPAAATSLTLQTYQSGTWTTRGTISVNTGGTLSLPTFGSIDLTNAGDQAAIVGQATADTGFKDFCLTVDLERIA